MLQNTRSKSPNAARSVTRPRAAWPSGQTASPAIRRAIERWLDLTQCWIEADRYDRPIVARQIDRATSALAGLIEATRAPASR